MLRLVLFLAFALQLSSCNLNHIKQLPATLLIRDDNPEKQADYIIIMMGKVIPRAEHAAKLFKKGYADKIIFAEAEWNPLVEKGFLTPDGEATRTMLLASGVPSHAITFLADSRNTNSKDELDLILRHIRNIDPKAKRLILSTSWYHSSRAHWVANRLGYDQFKIESHPTPAPYDFWQKEADFLWVYQEYLKWLYYLIHY
jgi:uncharacterized SAM-binding protein YcdF (DUF218 family)